MPTTLAGDPRAEVKGEGPASSGWKASPRGRGSRHQDTHPLPLMLRTSGGAHCWEGNWSQGPTFTTFLLRWF